MMQNLSINQKKKKLVLRSIFVCLLVLACCLVVFFLTRDDASEDDCIDSSESLVGTVWKTIPSDSDPFSLSLTKNKFQLSNFRGSPNTLEGSWSADFSDINKVILRLDFESFDDTFEQFIQLPQSDSEITGIGPEQFNKLDLDAKVVEVVFVSSPVEMGDKLCITSDTHINFGGIALHQYDESFESLRGLVSDCSILNEYIVEGAWENGQIRVELNSDKNGFIYFLSPPSEPITYAEFTWQYEADNIVVITPNKIYENGENFFQENNFNDAFDLTISYKADMPEYIGEGCHAESYKLSFPSEEILPLFRINHE